MLSATIAKRLTSGHRRDLLRALRPNNPGTADIVIYTAPRFLSTFKLSRTNEAIDGMLEVITTTQSVAAKRGLTCQLRTRMPAHTPRLFLSHHTFDTVQTRAMRADGATVMHFKAADLPGRTIFDPEGFSGWSSLAQQTVDNLPLDTIPQHDADAAFAAARQQITEQNLSKYVQSDEVAPSGDYVFVALQTIGDLVQKKAYVPMLEMLAIVVAEFAGSGTTVVVKRHPKCRSNAVADALRDLSASPDVIISQASIHSLLAGAKALFTVNSGVGSEAIVHSVPIYCFGAADYAAVAHQVQNAQTLHALTQPIQHKVSPADLHRFHSYYRNTYQVARATGLTDRINALIDTST